MSDLIGIAGWFVGGGIGGFGTGCLRMTPKQGHADADPRDHFSPEVLEVLAERIGQERDT